MLRLGKCFSFFVVLLFSSSVFADYLVPFVVDDESTKGTGWIFLVKLIIWFGTSSSIVLAMKFIRSTGIMLLKNDYIEAIPNFISGALCLIAAEYFRHLLNT